MGTSGEGVVQRTQQRKKAWPWSKGSKRGRKSTIGWEGGGNRKRKKGRGDGGELPCPSSQPSCSWGIGVPEVEDQLRGNISRGGTFKKKKSPNTGVNVTAGRDQAFASDPREVCITLRLLQTPER